MFLSYARSDDEEFVATLHQRLSDAGFTVWWDRICMPSRALTFLHEIRDAISSSDRVIVVLGPGATGSDYVRAEWQHALAEGKAITPVLRLGDYNLVPAELQPFHCPDGRTTREQGAVFAEIERVLKEPVPLLGSLHGEIPGSPAHFQPRPDDLTRIAETVLLDERNPVTLMGGQRAAVLHGMGGLGKTVLAAAFARSTAARRTFPDGVYWLVAAEDAEPLRLVRQMLTLQGDSRSATPDLPSAMSRMRELLAKKRVLIIIDNVWSIEPLEPFVQALDTNTRVLATTRNAGLANALGANDLSLGVLSEDSALRYLADWSGKPADTLPPEARTLAHECGYLPFALALNGAMLREGASWMGLIEALRSAELDFAETRFANYPYPNVLRSIKVSFDALRREDADAVERFREFAAFLGEESIPVAAVAALWRYQSKIEGRRVEKLLLTFERRSLVRLDGEREARRVTLHDLQRDFLRAIVEDRAALNAALLAAYWDLCSDDWPSGPNDGYFHRHLIAHLLLAGNRDEVHRLLGLETAKGRNAWYEANDVIGDLEGYLGDIDAAWRLSDQSFASETTGLEAASRGAVALQCRYALIIASVNSLATNLPPALLRMLVETGDPRWPISWALSQARRNTEEKYRAQAVAALAPYLPPELLHIAVEISGVQAVGVAALAPRLAEAERRAALTKVLDADVTTLISERPEQVVMKLAEWLPPDLIGKALGVVRAINYGDDRGKAIAALAPYLTEESLNDVTEILSWLTLGSHQDALACAIAALAPRLDNETRRQDLAEVLTLVRASEDPRRKARGLVALAPRLDADERRAVLVEALDAVRLSHKRELWRIEALISIASQLPDAERRPVLEESLQLAESFTDFYSPDGRAQALAVLAPSLPDDMLGRLLNALRGIKQDLGSRPAVLTAVVMRLSNEMLAEAIEIARAIEEPMTRVRAFAALVPRLPEAERRGVLAEALTTVQTIEYPVARVHALVDLVPLLLDTERLTVLAESVAIARTIGDTDALADALLACAVHLPDELLQNVLAAIRQRRHPSLRPIDQSFTAIRVSPADTLGALGPRLRGDLLGEALESARGLKDASERAESLAALTPWLSLDDRRTVLVEIQETSTPIRDAVALASRMPEIERRVLLAKALEMARAIEYAAQRLEAIVEVAPALPDAERLTVCVEAFGMIRESGTPSRLEAETLVRLAPWLPDSLIREAVNFLEKFADEGWRAVVLASLTPRIPHDLIEAVVAVAYRVKDTKWRVKVLAALAPRLPDDDRRSALAHAFDVAVTIDDDDLDLAAEGAGLETDGSRGEALRLLAPHLPEDLIGKALAVIRTKTINSGNDALVLLAPRLPDPLLAEALETVRALENEYGRAQAIAALAPRLRDELLQDALVIAMAIRDERHRSCALLSLAPRLADGECSAVLLEAFESVLNTAFHEAETIHHYLAAQLARLPEPVRGGLWVKTLRGLASSDKRSDLISALVVLGPVATTLTHKEWRTDLARAIIQVARWFP